MPEPGPDRPAPRIASLLPAATEIVAAVGALDQLVGRSHECDFPPDVRDRTVLTRPRRALPEAGSGAIDRTVREILADAAAVYEVDVDALRRVGPEVVVTQDLCDVCAVSLDDVRGALREFAEGEVDLVSLRPTRLPEVWNDVRRVGAAFGREVEGEAAAADLERRCAEIARRSRDLEQRSVLTVEWLDPVMVGGTWMPELVELAGGRALVTEPGQHAPTLTLDQLAELDPDVVLVKPCGFDLERTRGELDLLASNLPWTTWSAVGRGDVYVTDGNAYFNRPGPRLVESLEILAAAVHPREFATFRDTHAASLLRVRADLGLESVGADPAHG